MGTDPVPSMAIPSLGDEEDEQAAVACAINPALAATSAAASSEAAAHRNGFPDSHHGERANGHAGEASHGKRAYQTSHAHGAPRRQPVRRVRVGQGDGKWLTMHSVLCLADNVKAATRLAHASLPKPQWSPPEELIRAPIWTTWARYKAGVTQEQTENFAAEIANRKLPRSVMEIDDRWQAGYGELDFDMQKFPDPKEMVDKLHEMGFKVCYAGVLLLEIHEDTSRTALYSALLRLAFCRASDRRVASCAVSAPCFGFRRRRLA